MQNSLQNTKESNKFSGSRFTLLPGMTGVLELRNFLVRIDILHYPASSGFSPAFKSKSAILLGQLMESYRKFSGTTSGLFDVGSKGQVSLSHSSNSVQIHPEPIPVFLMPEDYCLHLNDP